MKGETDHDAKNSGHHHACVHCCRRFGDGLRRSADPRSDSQADLAADTAATTHRTANGSAADRSSDIYHCSNRRAYRGAADSCRNGYAFNSDADPAAAYQDTRPGNAPARGHGDCSPAAFSQGEHCLSQE